MTPERNQETVSVIIPGYNAASTAVEAVQSVLAQTWPNVECIYVDDGSSDDTRERLAPYMDRIRYLRKENGGFASARNLGMQQARGDFIAWLDADDIFRPDKLERQMAVFDACPHVALVCTDFSLFEGGDDTCASGIRQYYGVFESGLRYEDIFSARQQIDGTDIWSGQVLDTLLRGNFIHPPTVMFRKSVFETIGPQLEYLVNATDYEYLTRIASQYPVAFVDAPLLRYRISENQSSSQKNFARNSRFNEMAIEHMQASLKLTPAQQAVMRQRLCSTRLGLARHLAVTDKKDALLALWRAGPLRAGIGALIVLMKIMTPAFLIHWRRRRLVHADGVGGR